MRFLVDLSIRNKIAGIILITTILALIIGFTVVMTTSVQNFERELVTQTGLLARVLGEYSAIHLSFDDVDSAKADLRKLLRGVPDFVHACLFDDQDREFACYSAGEPAPAAPILPRNLSTQVQTEAVVEIRGRDVFAYQPIFNRDDADEDKIWLGTIYLRATTGDLPQQIRQFQLFMGGLTAFLVAAAIIFAYFLQGFISKPILHLAAQTQSISQHGDYSIRVQKPGNDEIGMLYDSFNEMLTQIQRRQEDLERSNRDLDQFAYVASHDLKAPLRAIATLSGWIEEDLGDGLSEEGREQLKLLRSRVRRMDGLIDGILRYSRVGRTSVQDEEVNVEAMLHELIEMLAPPTQFKITIGPGMPVLLAPRLRLEQIFSNLINNAIKYHDREDGRIEVTVSRQERFYEFTVADDGPGIAPEHHERVFRMFQTLQPRDKIESTGLGLALVKKLVEEEGGRITLESDVGQGAKFRFTWPLDRASLSAPRQG